MIGVDSTFYLDTYLGKNPGSDLARLLSRASDDVELACPNGIVEADLSADEVTLVKKAVCAQVEFYTQNGDVYNESEVAGGEQIGSFQRSVGYQQRRSPAALCPRAMAYLEQSGVAFRGVSLL